MNGEVYIIFHAGLLKGREYSRVGRYIKNYIFLYIHIYVKNIISSGGKTVRWYVHQCLEYHVEERGSVVPSIGSAEDYSIEIMLKSQ